MIKIALNYLLIKTSPENCFSGEALLYVPKGVK